MVIFFIRTGNQIFLIPYGLIDDNMAIILQSLFILHKNQTSKKTTKKDMRLNVYQLLKIRSPFILYPLIFFCYYLLS